MKSLKDLTKPIVASKRWLMLLVLLIPVGWLLSFTPEVSTMNELKKWYADPENGFTQHRSVQIIDYKVQYRPVDLMIQNELTEQIINDDVLLDSLRATYGESHYFLLEIALKPEPGNQRDNLVSKFSSDYEGYREQLKTLAFSMGEKLELQRGEAALEPSLVHYEHVMEMADAQRFLVAFPKDVTDKETALTFIINDDLFGGGRLKFHFDPNFSNTPSLPRP